ncbi:MULTISPECIES: hypothetical protein [unclassified Streptomyces]|uniref:hypothetical protein n=1 Tax=unclassified Streptomyces TaxID=2593676 RepID=UPI0036F15058
MSLDPTSIGQARYTMHWNTALKSLDTTFDGRLSAARRSECAVMQESKRSRGNPSHSGKKIEGGSASTRAECAPAAPADYRPLFPCKGPTIGRDAQVGSFLPL